MKIGIDFSFNIKECEYNSFFKQLQVCHQINLNTERNPMQIHLLNIDSKWNNYVKPKILNQLNEEWCDILVHDKKDNDILNVFPDPKNIIYLSQDSPNILTKEEFLANKQKWIYIIPGISNQEKDNHGIEEPM